MSMVLLILILVAGVIVHWLYTSCFTVVHFGFQSVFTEWFWCIIVGAIIVALIGKALVYFKLQQKKGGRRDNVMI